MSALIISSQHCTEGSSKGIMQEKRSKRHPDWVGRSKIAFIYRLLKYMYVCIESLMEIYKKSY